MGDVLLNLLPLIIAPKTVVFGALFLYKGVSGLIG
jgi:hypothetical protein